MGPPVKPGTFEEDWRDIVPGPDPKYLWAGLLRADGSEIEGEGYGRARIPADWREEEIEFWPKQTWGKVSTIGLFQSRCSSTRLSTIAISKETEIFGPWAKDPGPIKFILRISLF